MILTGETAVWSIGGMILTGETEVWSIGGMILTGETEVWSIGGMILTGETEVWSVGGMILTGENEVLGEKPVPMSKTNKKFCQQSRRETISGWQYWEEPSKRKQCVVQVQHYWVFHHLSVIEKGNCFTPVTYTSTIPHDAGVEEVVYVSRLCSNYIVQYIP